MKTAIPKLFLAAALVASIPFPGRARACDDDHRAPAPAAYDDRGYVDRGWRGGDRDGWRDRDQGGERGWRHDGSRARERERLRVELANLDRQRDEFYAQWGWHPRKVARFERWYAAHRADLQRQWDALSWYAAR